ncbi:hypothetical protein [Streptomyces albicerus]|jgi:hypothetical protein|uniref:hypothetical protein n=1 Tax=Streptomyces albicerus TaxID=2569859 RepID=UPI001788CC80|nr:hypothetical protein [Streptomyces albicerus]
MIRQARCPGEEFRKAGKPTAMNLDYDLPFIPEVTGAVDVAAAEPGTLLPGAR